jgi:hypothetical protein
MAPNADSAASCSCHRQTHSTKCTEEVLVRRHSLAGLTSALDECERDRRSYLPEDPQALMFASRMNSQPQPPQAG